MTGRGLHRVSPELLLLLPFQAEGWEPPSQDSPTIFREKRKDAGSGWTGKPRASPLPSLSISRRPGAEASGPAGPLLETQEAQGAQAQTQTQRQTQSISRSRFCPTGLTPLPRTRQKQNHPQTVMLRLSTIIKKSKPAALYNMHLSRLRTAGRCVTLGYGCLYF